MWYLNKPLSTQASGGGNVLAYNYVDDAIIAAQPWWQETSIDGSHASFSHLELFEGNWTPNLSVDTTHGNAGWHTFFRNYATGINAPPSTATDSISAVNIHGWHREMTVVGNVLLQGKLVIKGFNRSTRAAMPTSPRRPTRRRPTASATTPIRASGTGRSTTGRRCGSSSGTATTTRSPTAWSGIPPSPATICPRRSTRPQSPPSWGRSCGRSWIPRALREWACSRRRNGSTRCRATSPATGPQRAGGYARPRNASCRCAARLRSAPPRAWGSWCVRSAVGAQQALAEIERRPPSQQLPRAAVGIPQRLEPRLEPTRDQKVGQPRVAAEDSGVGQTDQQEGETPGNRNPDARLPRAAQVGPQIRPDALALVVDDVEGLSTRAGVLDGDSEQIRAVLHGREGDAHERPENEMDLSRSLTQRRHVP